MILYVIGVSGSGKTLIGGLLAKQLGFAFYDGDDFHSAENKAKMAAGLALNDGDRGPWLAAINKLALDVTSRRENAVIACSALKQSYRDRLSWHIPKGSVRFILLEGSRALIADRLQQRTHEYMNPQLLDSQISTLEMPLEALRICNTRSPEETVSEIVVKLGLCN